jgi:hypothetical protein
VVFRQFRPDIGSANIRAKSPGMETVQFGVSCLHRVIRTRWRVFCKVLRVTESDGIGTKGPKDLAEMRNEKLESGKEPKKLSETLTGKKLKC